MLDISPGDPRLVVLPSSRSVGVGNSESKASASRSVLGDGSSVNSVVVTVRAGKPVITLELDVLAVLSDAEALDEGASASGGRVRGSEAQATVNGNVDLLATGDNGVEAESVVTTNELGGSGVGAGRTDDVRAVGLGVLQEPELLASSVDRSILNVRARVDGKTAKGTGRSRALVEGVLAEAGSVVGGTLGHVGRETVRAASGSAGVVCILTSTLAGGVVGRALGLVGRKASDGVASTAGVVLGDTARGSGRGRSNRGGEGRGSQGQRGEDHGGSHFDGGCVCCLVV